MLLPSLSFGSLLTYTPRGTSVAQRNSKTFCLALKTDEYLPIEPKPILMTDYISDIIKDNLTQLPFAGFITNKTILVPTPKSSLIKPDSLWVPQRLTRALANRGLGRAVVECLNRVTAVQKAATSQASERPKATDHYASLEVIGALSEPEEILLIDDVITRGATLLGAASRLKEAFPQANIRGLAMVRTISQPDRFVKILDPCVGTIELSGMGTIRQP